MLQTPRCSLGPSIATPSSWSKEDQHVQLSYELPHRVNSAEFYPLRAPNGSLVIVYGHEHGLTCVWKGGKPFKRPNRAPAQLRASSSSFGRSADDVIMIDNENNASNGARDADLIHFNEGLNSSAATLDEAELDSSQPFDSIIHSLEISLDSAALHISFPPLPSILDDQAPRIFQSSVVVAAGCTNGSVHLVTIPLSPSTSADPENCGVKDLVVVEPSQSTRDIPLGLSLTWTAALDLSFREAYPMLYSQESGQFAAGPPPSWSFLLSCLTSRKSGVLKVFEVTLAENTSVFQPGAVSAIRDVLLSSPAKSISFNDAFYPYETHTQILVTDNQGAARVYEPLLRQVSQALEAPDLSLDRLGDAWLASLFAPFERTGTATKSTSMLEKRTEILDARWAFGGQAILALLEDGQWGIWDISGVGPGPRQNLFANDSTMTGLRISGGGVTRFALRGYIGHGAGRLSSNAKQSSESTANTTKLAPMTPNTRKAKQDALFNLPAPKPAVAHGYNIGGISLTRGPADAVNDGYDDSLFIWYNSNIYYAPSLMSYWVNVAKNSSLPNRRTTEDDAGTLFGHNFSPFQSLSAEGEMITNISQTRHQISQSSRSPSSSLPALQHDVLVSAEHRLLMFCPLKQHEDATAGLSTLFDPPKSSPDDGLAKQADEELLQRGELDLGAMDRMLDNMERRALNGSRLVEFSNDY